LSPEKENWTLSYFIDFEPLGRRGQCPGGQSLLDCARELGVDIVNICGGTASCGTCKVQVVEGKVSPPSSEEQELFTPRELEEGCRLACKTTPLSDCRIHVPAESLSAPQRTQVEGMEISVRPEPPVRTCALALQPPSLEDLRADAQLISEAAFQQFHIQVDKIDISVLINLSGQVRRCKWHPFIAIKGKEIIALYPSRVRSLGMAVDLGTTKIAGYMVDMENGRILASQGIMNPQIDYGEDLIARIMHASETPTQAKALQKLVVDSLNQLACDLCAEIGAEPAQILETLIVANTAMHHLFLGLEVAQLASAPYVPTIQAALDVKARDLGLNTAPGAYVHILPNIAGFVGADHVAMLLSTEVNSTEETVLALDIGTNTEVCLSSRGRMSSVSCASGPAFEGAHIKHGMRAADGSIEYIRLTGGRIEYQTIGNKPPVGLCGSGVLDAMAELYKAGILNSDGRMGEHRRVRSVDGIREFVLLTQEELDGRREISITQKDIRELQLAKGAIQTGIRVLLENHGISEEEIDRVIIAGAFGSYINISSAISIGMLPPLPKERFRQVGNAAGMGAISALISTGKRDEARTIADQVEYIELASTPEFMHIFTQTMSLG
jgi:uncharacterized 2Fe-2S/4Fe-4S cluster protein (DUF4445 family)